MPAADTRDRLQRHALALIAEQGFDQTTVEQIASAAGVSHMTFFRHFPTKESVVLDDPYDPVIAEQVAATSPRLPPVDRVRTGLLAAWAQLPEPADDQVRLRIRITAGHAGLRARMWEANQATMDLIVEALGVDGELVDGGLADGTDRLRATAAAGACMGALTAALLDWGADDGGQPLGDRVRAALEVLDPQREPAGEGRVR
ncbi:TetR family transcriptional regulator [Euzebya sp.]|uniref:TetR family transcriptional regulator n=1 Tax=Euzebya sp. TaxID=1971409 RepID=UPI00351353ED